MYLGYVFLKYIAHKQFQVLKNDSILYKNFLNNINQNKLRPNFTGITFLNHNNSKIQMKKKDINNSTEKF